MRFALGHGFRKGRLLTAASRKAWKQQREAARGARWDDHDTIGIVALDGNGGMAASCTTSGLAYKLPGRVGDSPLVGHGLYCDERAGGAVATGVGEEVIKVCGSYQVVEFMRQGIEPDEAVRRVLERMLRRDPAGPRHQVGIVALRADGTAGYASTKPGFTVTITRDGRHRTLDAQSLLG